MQSGAEVDELAVFAAAGCRRPLVECQSGCVTAAHIHIGGALARGGGGVRIGGWLQCGGHHQ